MRPKLQYMSTGPAVAELQGKLNLLMPTAIPPLKVDGKFGDKTLARVKQFQAGRGLVRDGIVGAKTWAAIDGQAVPPGGSQPAAGKPSPSSPPAWDYVFPLVRGGQMMYCTHGTEKRAIKISPPDRPANVRDHKTPMNVPPFGGCYSLQNPAVAAVNKTYQEAQGPLGPLFSPLEPQGLKQKAGQNVIPGACTPSLTQGWMGSHRVETVGMPPHRAIDKGCKAKCDYGGVVKFVT